MDGSPQRRIREQLDAQEWRCAYACEDIDTMEGAPIKPGDPIARAFDNHGIVHLQCASLGQAPPRD